MKKTLLSTVALSIALPVVGQVPPGSGTGTVGAGLPGGAPASSAPLGSANVNIGTGNGTAPLNPSGLRGLPPPTVGGTFSRPLILPPRAQERIVRPAPVLGFPPPESATVPLVPNTGIVGSEADPARIPGAPAFPPGPATVGNTPTTVENTVGQNFLTPAIPAQNPVMIDIPPGDVVTPNASVFPEIVVPATPPAIPPPVVVPPVNGVGGPAGVESGPASPINRPPAVRPPTAPVRPIPGPAPVRNPGARLPSVPRP